MSAEVRSTADSTKMPFLLRLSPDTLYMPRRPPRRGELNSVTQGETIPAICRRPKRDTPSRCERSYFRVRAPTCDIARFPTDERRSVQKSAIACGDRSTALRLRSRRFLRLKKAVEVRRMSGVRSCEMTLTCGSHPPFESADFPRLSETPRMTPGWTRATSFPAISFATD